MNIQITGRNGRKKKYVAYLGMVMALQLGLRNKNINLEIILTKEVGSEAMMASNGNDYQILVNPDSDLQPLGLALAHEMVHVKQYARGILKNLGNNDRSWAGKVYPASTPYLEQPWEIQALSQQELVLRRAFAA
jgi:hypothetical protein